MKKGRTVLLLNGAYTSAELYNATQPGGPLFGVEDTNGGLVVFAGGNPIFHGNHFIGSVGVSGGTPEQDGQVSAAAANAI